MILFLDLYQAGKGGELTHDETTIIAGALELSEKTAKDAMTPISETFAIDINAKLDRYVFCKLLRKIAFASLFELSLDQLLLYACYGQGLDEFNFGERTQQSASLL